MTFPFGRRSRERHLALTGGFPDTGESVTEILERVRPAGYDARTCEFTGASGAGQGDPDGQIAAIREAGYRAWDTAPLARLRARGQQPDTFPALQEPDDTGPMRRMPKLRKVQQRPRPVRPADAAILVWVPSIGQHVLLCSLCRWRRHADPVAAHMPFGFEALRVSAYQAGWRLDAFAGWCCPACQDTGKYRTPYPVMQWDPDAAEAAAAGDGGAERQWRAAAEHDLILDVRDAAGHGRHRAVTR